MTSEVDSLTLLVASDPEDRASAARLAAEADPTSEFGATMRQVLEEIAQGSQLVIVRPERELTPAGAAELLGVTRQFVDRLLADGTLAFRRLPGSRHRRIKLADVLALSEERDRRRRGAEAIRSALRDSPDRA